MGICQSRQTKKEQTPQPQSTYFTDYQNIPFETQQSNLFEPPKQIPESQINLNSKESKIIIPQVTGQIEWTCFLFVHMKMRMVRDMRGSGRMVVPTGKASFGQPLGTYMRENSSILSQLAMVVICIKMELSIRGNSPKMSTMEMVNYNFLMGTTILVNLHMEQKMEKEPTISFRKPITKESGKTIRKQAMGFVNFMMEEYEGEWEDNKMHGQGTYKWGGRKYVGQYFKGLKHGQGSYYWNENTYYEGSWFQGKQEGEGKLYISGLQVQSGLWKEGQFAHK